MKSLSDQAFELTSSLWHRVFATVVFGSIAFVGLGGIVGGVFPHLSWINVKGENPAFLLIAGVVLTFVSVISWRSIVGWRVYADQHVLVENTGLRTTTVAWSDVAFYRLEKVKGTSERLIWPVLYGASGQVLLRPQYPTLIGSGGDLERRTAFWRFVEKHLEGKRAEA